MTKPKPFFICKNCNKPFYPDNPRGLRPRTEKYCSLPCAFWHRVTIGNTESCWPWNGSCHFWGYGEFRHKKKLYRAHVVAYALSFGWAKKSVLHKCDNPSCCNPAHLYEGTQADNMKDCAIRNRVANRKLTPAQVIEIRNNPNHISQEKLAETYRVSQTVISNIAIGKTWKYV